MLEAVIFDIDGLIIDNEPIHLQAYNNTLKKFDITISESEYAKFVGEETEDIFRYIINNYNISVRIENLIELKNLEYNNLIKNKLVPREGLLDLLDEIYYKGYKLAIATSSTRIEANYILSALGIANKFDLIASGEDSKRGKPDPEIYKFIANKLYISPSNCVVLEDSENGVKAAKLANMKCIAVPNSITKTNDFSEADLIIDDLRKVSIENIESLVQY